jgi:hypothetical protein
VLRGTASGSHTVGVTVATAGGDVNPADNTATTTITVTPPAVAPPSPPPPASIKLCTVPKLKGKTAAAAKLALTKSGCKPGKATGSKRKTAKVKTQAIPAGIRVIAGTNVNYTLATPTRHRPRR